MTSSNESFIVVSVSKISDRDKLIKQIYTDLTKEPSVQFTIECRVNKVIIYHNVGNGVKVPIRTYLVVVIPVLVDISPLLGMHGIIDFKLDNTINELTKLIDKLKSLQGRKVLKGKYNGETLGKLVDSLRDVNAKYGTSKTI